MAIQFERQERVARLLDPRAGYAETAITCELRRDPLTGRSGRVAHFAGFRLETPVLEPLIEASRAGCPFCPDRVLAVTPRFPVEVLPQGRVTRGECVVFPNLAPYDAHSAVAAMSRAHYVPIDGFTPAMLRDALEASREYLSAVQRLPETTFGMVYWNYLPASGGTQIHPHLQLFATDTPGNILERELAATAAYAAHEGGGSHSYWADLLAAEEAQSERFIARGAHTAWLMDFVSQGLLGDLLILLPGQRTLPGLPDAALDELCAGLSQALAALGAQGVYSFNLAFYPAPPDRPDFWLHARLSPRIYLSPRIWGSDMSTLQQLYDEHFMVRAPEEMARSLRGAIQLA